MRTLHYAFILITLFSGSASAQDGGDFSSSDIVGMFAAEGFEGANAGQKTMSQAHEHCTKQMAGGYESVGENKSVDSDAHQSYKSCMSDFVPFKNAGGANDSCGGEEVTWGQCSATLPASPSGAFISARNTFSTDTYEGYGNFQCNGNKWAYVSGGCSRAAQECEEGAVVDWPVTTPAWADETSGTFFVDRFGVPRHTPKGRCYASMPHALSGKLLSVNPTVPEMVEPERYDMVQSRESNRCFDGEWLGEDQSNAPCEYIPKTCPPMSYTHPSGCGYSIPAGQHDEVYSSNSPTPQNSVGGVQAHCWDGEWEIKSSSCQLSCDSTVGANTWSSGISGVNRMCAHESKGYGQRIVPSSNLLIPNETDGMTGSASYTCVNGTMVLNSESCSPLDCEGVPSNDWGGSDGSQCSHNTLPGEFAHGQTISHQVGDLFSEFMGEISYRCEYGKLVETGSSCGLSDQGDPICIAGEGDPDIDQCLEEGMIYNGEYCCLAGDDGTCMEIIEDLCVMAPDLCGEELDFCELNPNDPSCVEDEDICVTNPSDPSCADVGDQGGCKFDDQNYIFQKSYVYSNYTGEPTEKEVIEYMSDGVLVFSESKVYGPGGGGNSSSGSIDGYYKGAFQGDGGGLDNGVYITGIAAWEICKGVDEEEEEIDPPVVNPSFHWESNGHGGCGNSSYHEIDYFGRKCTTPGQTLVVTLGEPCWGTGDMLVQLICQ